MATRLPILIRWHYLKRSVGFNAEERPCFTFTLATKGRRWLDKHNADFGDEPIYNVAMALRDGTRLYEGTPEYDAFWADFKAREQKYKEESLRARVKILRWYELNSDVWVELKMQNGRLYFDDLPSEPKRYVCRNILSLNDVQMAWLQVYGDELPISLIRDAYHQYRRSLWTGYNQGIAVKG